MGPRAGDREGMGRERNWCFEGARDRKRLTLPTGLPLLDFGERTSSASLSRGRAGKKGAGQCGRGHLLLAACCPLFRQCQKNIEPHYPVTVPGSSGGDPTRVPASGQVPLAGALQVLSYRASAASTFVQNAMSASLLPDASLFQAEGVGTMVFGRKACLGHGHLSTFRDSFRRRRETLPTTPGQLSWPAEEEDKPSGVKRGETRGAPDSGREEKERGASVLSALEDGCLKQSRRIAPSIPCPSSVEVVVAFPSHRISISIPANAMQPPHLRFFRAACFEHGRQTWPGAFLSRRDR